MSSLTLDHIKSKLTELRDLDKGFKTFGSETHRYLLNPPKTETELLDFEKKYAIRIPGSYRDFLKNMGNGGAGPYYGIQPLESALFDDLDHNDSTALINPSIPFPHQTAWNLEFPEDEEKYYALRDNEYFDQKWITGVLRICNYGCGVFINLVVKGPEYGNIWVDDRCNDEGVYPDQHFNNKDRIDFLTWYNLWLDKSLVDIRTADAQAHKHT